MIFSNRISSEIIDIWQFHYIRYLKILFPYSNLKLIIFLSKNTKKLIQMSANSLPFLHQHFFLSLSLIENKLKLSYSWSSATLSLCRTFSQQMQYV